MKPTHTKLALALLALSCVASAQTTVGIASGQPTGTNYPMAQDIVRVCSTPTTKYANIVSDGTKDNVYKVRGDRNSQFGIAQIDGLYYLAGEDKATLDKIVMVFPFFSTEVHVIVKEDSPIKSLADLQGKRVVEGPDGSGTWVTVQMIKHQTGISWTPMLAGQKDGLNMVQAGQADAEFIVAGSPITMLEDKNLKGVRLLPISNKKLEEVGFYTKAFLPSGTYPFQKTAVNTYKVDNALITFDYKNTYQQQITDLVTCITRNIGTLQRTGHPKWRDVNPLDIERIKWPSHAAAVKAIQRESKAAK